MKLWGSFATRCALVAPMFLACTEGASETPSVSDGGAGRGDAANDAGVASTGGAPDIGVIWTAGAGGAGPDFERCGSGTPSQAGATASPSPPARLGFAQSNEVTLEGRVSSLTADGMEIETQEGTSTFVWRGPPLDTSFDVDDAVQIVTDFGGYGFSPPTISIVRSERATAAAVDGNPWVGLGTEPGSTTTLQGLDPAFPELVYGVVSCCATGERSYYTSYYACDYSALDARFDGSSTPIARGATGVVGPWSITNVQSSYFQGSEAAWSIKATLLGPAMPRSPDGGI